MPSKLKRKGRPVTELTADVIVVGGRLAGAATAMLLARSGLDVAVLERGRYGSDTLSTHAFMRGGVVQLSRWGLLGEIVDAGTPAVRRTTMRYGDVDEVIDIKPKPGVEALYAPRRALLDRVLVDAAMRAGADVRFGWSVSGLERDVAGRVTGVTGRDDHGRSVTVRAPLTIGADGVKSTVARMVGAPVLKQGRNATALAVNWFDGVEADGYQWLYGPGLSVGVIPTNDGKVCAWIGVPWTRFDALRHEPDLGFHRLFPRVAPDWVDRLAAGTPEGPFRGFPGIRGFVRQSHGPGWALVGDAAHFKDPITAHGMTDALRDAELLARAVTGGGRIDQALADYVATRDQLSNGLMDLADRVAAYDWTMEELRDLLLEMSASMRDEVDYLAALDHEPAVA
jgi:flavin-dependent dehydrogenase